MKDVLTSLILVIISQYLHVSKYHIVCLKLTLREMFVEAGDGASRLDAVHGLPPIPWAPVRPSGSLA